jgi:predicted Zn finger-like uncharacterized protein
MKCFLQNSTGACAWAPKTGEALQWEYVCESCHAQFSVDVPKGPAQERALKCPVCSSPDIRKVTAYRMAESGCGG